ncbi:hypothetical protein WALSEDRAFT_58448 [Wallemia mellicola CBS 633.66]|nr:hypothetical protein WALSEDRAFT_58448 [Wallemia mellicola CBS 633.66]EIM19866.1 hypothetical protein WALSEDRAFT_58448 [Wallemia mellicola CBS 633.66]|eukprot:XP_006960008.1 hypothetical protein WALSEDRAFT_58448 [Wallemia mellicola CBS 633.66]
MPKVIQLDREIVQDYIERGDLRSNDLDLLNSSLQTTLRYVGFGAVVGGGSLFYLARRYQRRWPLPTFAGVVSGTFLGQYAGAMSFASHFKAEGRDPRLVLQTLATISRESDIKRAERAAAGVKNRVSEPQHTSRWDQLRDTPTVDNKRSNTNNEKDTIKNTPDSSSQSFYDTNNFPRSSEDFSAFNREVKSYRSATEKDL